LHYSHIFDDLDRRLFTLACVQIVVHFSSFWGKMGNGIFSICGIKWDGLPIEKFLIVLIFYALTVNDVNYFWICVSLMKTSGRIFAV